MFAHRKLETLAIMFTYEELDPFGMEIQLKTVEVTKNMVPRGKFENEKVYIIK